MPACLKARVEYYFSIQHENLPEKMLSGKDSVNHQAAVSFVSL